MPLIGPRPPAPRPSPDRGSPPPRRTGSAGHPLPRPAAAPAAPPRPSPPGASAARCAPGRHASAPPGAAAAARRACRPPEDRRNGDREQPRARLLLHRSTRRYRAPAAPKGRTVGRWARSVRPVVWSDVAKRIPPPDAEHYLDLLTELVRARTVALVHHVDVGDLHYPGLQRLNPVARFGHQYEDRRLGGARDVELRLPDAHRLYQHALEAERLEQIGDFLRRRGEPPLRPPRRHRPDEHAGVEAYRFHPDPVAEQRAPRERAGGIHGHDADGETLRAEPLDQRFGEGALAGARGTGDADAPRTAAPEQGVRVRQHPLEPVALVLDQGDGAGQGGGLTPGEPLQNPLGRHARPMLQIRSSARSSGTVRTGPGRTATRSTRVAVAARMSNSSPCSAKRSPGRGMRPKACTSSPATVWTPRASKAMPSPSSSRLAGALPSSSTIRTGGSSVGGGPPGSKISDTRSRSRSSNVTRPAVPPNSSSTTARWLRPRCISSMRSAARVVPGTTSAGRTGTGASGGRRSRSNACVTPMTSSSDPRYTGYRL